MIQPVLRVARVLTRGLVVRKISVQCSSVESTRLLKKSRNVNNPRRQFHHPTEKNVITSNYEDIEIPNCTLNEFIWKDLELWADKTAVVCGITGRGYTYGQAYKMCVSLAASLRNKLKLRDGDCVAVMLPNSPEFPLSALGAVKAGCIVTTVNPIYTADEIKKQLENSEAKVIITTKDCHRQVKTAIDSMNKSIAIILTECGDSPLPEGAIHFSEFAENFSIDTDCLKDVRRKPDDTVFLPYSSGTTGLPKGVELTHKNIMANCIQMTSGRLQLAFPAIGTNQDVSISVLPFFHIYGLSVTLLSRMMLGVKIVTLPKFNPITFINAQEKYNASLMFLVPPIILFMSTNTMVTKKHLNPIKTIMSSAAPMAASDVEKFIEKAPNVAVLQGYGLTETSPVVLMPERGNINYSSVGTPVPNTEAQIVSLDDESDVLGPNNVGELWVRGPQVMKGYLNNPKANDETFRPGGWMRTGDLAYYDENDFFYITDRFKELIKVKGYQVAPAELEAILRSHPELSDAAVVGIPHKITGETPKAFVVKKDGLSPSPENIMNFVASKVASYKKLGELMFVDSIPKNAAGKILRREIKAKFVNSN